MRSIDVLWFHHVQMSPFSITVGELQAPQHATVTNFVSTERFHAFSWFECPRSTQRHKRAQTSAYTCAARRAGKDSAQNHPNPLEWRRERPPNLSAAPLYRARPQSSTQRVVAACPATSGAAREQRQAGRRWWKACALAGGTDPAN